MPGPGAGLRGDGTPRRHHDPDRHVVEPRTVPGYDFGCGQRAAAALDRGLPVFRGAASHTSDLHSLLFRSADPPAWRRIGDSGPHGPGQNPYTDAGAIRAQAAFVSSIAKRFKDVPFFSFDLINEPSFSNPRQPWRGNTPNGDPSELAAWRSGWGGDTRRWRCWRRPGTCRPRSSLRWRRFRCPRPAIAALARSGNPRLVRAGDYNLFRAGCLQPLTAEMIRVIRECRAAKAAGDGRHRRRRRRDGWLKRFVSLGGRRLHHPSQLLARRRAAMDSLAAKRPDKPT